MDIEQTLTDISEKVDRLLAHFDKGAGPVDSSQSHDPYAPDQPVQRVAQAQEASAQELAPPNTGEGDGPGTVHPEVFPQAADSQPEAIVPSGEPQDPGIALSDGSTVGAGAPEAAQEPADAPAAPEAEGQDAQAPAEPQSAPEPQAPGDQPVVAPVPAVDDNPAEPNPTQPAPTEQPVSPAEQTPTQGGQA